MRSSIPVLSTAIFLLVVQLAADTRAFADDATTCASGTGDAQIAACTREIKSGRWKNSHLAWAYNNRCKAYNDRGKHDRAIADCNEAVRLDPNVAGIYYNRAIAYDDKGDHARAIADYTEAIWLDAKFALAYYRRGLAEQIIGDWVKAEVDIAVAKQLDPKAFK